MKLIYPLILYFAMSSNIVLAQDVKTPADIVQENLDFYNQRNIEGFMSSFSDSIALFMFGKTEPVAMHIHSISNLNSNFTIQICR